MSKGKAAPKRKINGYKMPDPLPLGEILTDTFKKQWRLGKSIGKGGFGEIYATQEAGAKGKDYPYVIKIEPHGNGPLFVEMHFYTRNAKQVDIDAFKLSNKLQSLGMPAYIGSGSHEHKNEKYRFIVMEKFSTDIWKLYLENNKKFNSITVYKLGLQMLDVLEYIHSRGYIHADIKGSNILLSTKNPNQAYLVDFGLAGRFTSEKEFKPNPKKQHDGTIEYLSRDAHAGVQTRRGDLEILAYNLLHWLGCTLPWENDLKSPINVQKSKEKHMDNLSLFMKSCFKNDKAPDAIVQFLKYINTLEFNEEPDYKKIRKLFNMGLKEAGGNEKSPLEFTKSSAKRKSIDPSTTPQKRSRSRKAVEDLKENVVDSPITPRRGRRNVTTKKSESDSDEEENDQDLMENVDVPVTSGRGRRKIVKKTESDSGVEENVQDVKENVVDVPITPRRGGRRNITKQPESDSDDEEEQIPKKVIKPKARTRRVASESVVSNMLENGAVLNKEMLRIQTLVLEKQKNGASKKRVAKKKLNRSLDVIPDVDDDDDDEEEEEVLPISKRSARNAK